MTTISANLQSIHARIDKACRQAHRDSGFVALLAVSKTFGVEAVEQAHVAGQTAFGENYVQEAVVKIHALRHLALQWHCIGPIQSNKTRVVAESFDWVHTVDRIKIAQRLSDQRPANLPPLQVCIQVNVDGGPTKSGVAPDAALALATAVAAMPGLCLRGIMCIPDDTPDLIALSSVMTGAREVFVRMQLAGLAVDTLSMGMSADLETAIACGSTLVRVGSAIFGGRARGPIDPLALA